LHCPIPTPSLFPYTTLFRSEMILKFDAVLSDLAQFRERENLISAAIRQNWSIPIHEFVQAAKIFDHIQSRANKQVIGISKNDLRDRKSTRLNSSHEWISYAV